MSIQFPRAARSDRAAGSLLTLPLAAISGAVTLARAAFGHSGSAAGTVNRPPLPEVTPNRQYEIADRVYSHYFGPTKVSFYHYTGKGLIRAVARKGSCTKELDFTPVLADKSNVPFNMDGAIAFIRENGFKTAKIAGNKRQTQEADTPSQQPAAEPQVKAEPTEARAPTSTRRTHQTQLQSTTVPNKNRPFTGRVLYAGESTRPGRDGQPDYTTYMVKLQSESGGFEREFLGEHLAELVDTHGVKEGSVVRLQRLGRNRFEVEVNGVKEERWRNEYALTVL